MQSSDDLDRVINATIQLYKRRLLQSRMVCSYQVHDTYCQHVDHKYGLTRLLAYSILQRTLPCFHYFTALMAFICVNWLWFLSHFSILDRFCLLHNLRRYSSIASKVYFLLYRQTHCNQRIGAISVPHPSSPPPSLWKILSFRNQAVVSSVALKRRS